MGRLQEQDLVILAEPREDPLGRCADEDLSIWRLQTGCCAIVKRGFADRQIFEGHTHYIMALAINPKDTQTFASACLDHTVKVWSLGNPVPNFSLDAHEKGVNYVDYYHGGDRPYIVTTGDDR